MAKINYDYDYYDHHHHRFIAFCLGLPGWAGTRRNIHQLTPTIHDRESSFICFLHLLQSIASSLFNLHPWQSFLHNLYPSPLWSAC